MPVDQGLPCRPVAEQGGHLVQLVKQLHCDTFRKEGKCLMLVNEGLLLMMVRVARWEAELVDTSSLGQAIYNQHCLVSIQHTH